jgi:hypothetical protein
MKEKVSPTAKDASEFIPMVARLGLKHRRRMKSGMRRLKLVQKDI